MIWLEHMWCGFGSVLILVVVWFFCFLVLALVWLVVIFGERYCVSFGVMLRVKFSFKTQKDCVLLNFQYLGLVMSGEWCSVARGGWHGRDVRSVRLPRWHTQSLNSGSGAELTRDSHARPCPLFEGRAYWQPLHWDNLWKSRGGIVMNGAPREVPESTQWTPYGAYWRPP